MTKPELEFFDYSNIKSVQFSDVKGLTEKVLAEDSKTKVATRILEFAPGVDTTPNGVQVHDFWEELYIIEGSIVDLVLNEEFSQGEYACRPPGMKHGPWKSPNGCKIFEVRYYK